MIKKEKTEKTDVENRKDLLKNMENTILLIIDNI